MSAWHRSTTCWMLIGLTARELAAHRWNLLIVKKYLTKHILNET